MEATHPQAKGTRLLLLLVSRQPSADYRQEQSFLPFPLLLRASMIAPTVSLLRVMLSCCRYYYCLTPPVLVHSLKAA